MELTFNMARPVVTVPIGTRFTKLVTVGQVYLINRGYQRQAWVAVRCDCGKVKHVAVTNLRRSQTKSCGCLFDENRHVSQREIIAIGSKFGRWEVVGEPKLQPRKSSRSNGLEAVYPCRCACGTTRDIRDVVLRNKSRSCGCSKTGSRKRGRPTTEIEVGSRFGRLVTTSETFLKPRSDGRNRTHVAVRCDCGKTKHVLAYMLLNEKVQSCGCLQRERAAELMRIHGARSKEAYGTDRRGIYNIWKGIKLRCYTPSARNYRWYGEKGIKLCDEWQDFEVFFEWSIANGYSKGLQIDRIDSKGDYQPDNCRWSTQKKNLRSRDVAWDDATDQRLIFESKNLGISPYELIRRAVIAYLGD
ncbi:hypothetical protein ACFYY8_11795 [Streptosporangium sp. NPDC001559]|uniref:hypothetical protein n=1 Tax=Streptosporangium sp. NPDC001559 TaxID=3366187 RepID=UPI0036EE76D5